VREAEGIQNRPKVPAGSPTRKSLCEPFREFITDGLDQGLSAQRIWQDLVADHGFEGGYDSVKRFTRGLRSSNQLPFRRIECDPGEEAQVDFGTGAFIDDGSGKRRRPHVLRVVLSHSRKAYSEAVFRQSTENFIRVMENSFHHFGGVVRIVIIDNLKAAVNRADWYDPEMNPKIRAFAAHYGTTVLPHRPYTPRHKGKVERGVGYVKDNGLKGRTFPSLAEHNSYLLEWESKIADTRIHGTTRRQVGKLFEEIERPALQPLPPDRFPFFHEAERTVHRDGHVEVDKSYYSVPPEYLGLKVWVRWDGRVVRVFNQRMEQVAIHAKAEPGRFKTHRRHIVEEKISGVERGTAYYLKRIERIGPHAARWSEAVVKKRGVEAVRVLLGLLNLANRHSWIEIERACETAWSHRSFNLRAVRELIKQQAPRQEEFEFMDEHPIIRSLSEYEQLVRDAFKEDQ
ncbi:MAG: IS21 family transposase, partial [Chitinivibrionales bacterium]|nr:IS21 family transposase [Chitinivibrionales bacterium]